LEEIPFVEPLEAGLVKEHDINPSIANIDDGIEKVETTVAERLGSVEPALPKEEKTTQAEIEAEAPAKPSKPTKKPTPAKAKEKKEEKKEDKKTPKAKKPAEDDFIDYGSKRELPKAEDMSPEVDLDALED
jgi:outer membrane biosynthesis protein TonB